MLTKKHYEKTINKYTKSSMNNINLKIRTADKSIILYDIVKLEELVPILKQWFGKKKWKEWSIVSNTNSIVTTVNQPVWIPDWRVWNPITYINTIGYGSLTTTGISDDMMSLSIDCKVNTENLINGINGTISI